MDREDPWLEELTDDALLAALAGPTRARALTQLLNRHGLMIAEVCRRARGNGPEADEAFRAAAQTVLCGTPRGCREPVSCWLYRLACRAVHQGRTGDSTAEMCRPDPDSAGVSIFAGDPWQELRPVLDREMGRLPTKYLEPLVLCCLEGLTIREAAGQLCWGAARVRRRLLRGRDLLRGRLARRGLSFSTGMLSQLLTREAAGTRLPSRLVTVTVQSAVEAARPPRSTAFLLPRVASLVLAEIRGRLPR